MTTLTWIGGGNNQASNPADWSPNQAPVTGDSLQIGGPDTQGASYTMNVSDNDLAGNTVHVFTGTNFNANLSHQATMSLDMGGFGSGDTGTFNLTQQSSLTASLTRADLTFNLSGNSTLDLSLQPSGALPSAGATINITGNDTVVLDDSGIAKINLLPSSQWNGTFNVTGAYEGLPFTVNGPTGATFDNVGNSTAAFGSNVTINADVIGKGNFDIKSNNIAPFDFKFEFAKSVGPNQTVSDEGRLQIDQPNLFSASVILLPAAGLSSGAPNSEIDLVGLANADSYSLKNDMLNIWSGNKIIDTLRFQDSTNNGFSVVQAAGSVDIVALTSPGQILPGALPLHVGS